MKAGEVMDATRDPLLKGIRKANSSLLIAAPFISSEVATDVSVAALASGVETRLLLTALNDRAVKGGFLSPAGLRILADSGFEIRSIRNLHAKVALVDGTLGIVGSGNLTASGLAGQKRKNLELGIGLSKSQAVAAEGIFRRWWKQGEPVGDSVLRKYEAMAPPKGQHSGGGHGPFVYDDEPEPPKQRHRRHGTGLWLKMLYHHTRRSRTGGERSHG